MYVYIPFDPGLWAVGFYAPNGRWFHESWHSSRDSAAQRAHYLNGGNPPAEKSKVDPPAEKSKVDLPKEFRHAKR